MPSLTYAHAADTDIPVIARLNAALFTQQGLHTNQDQAELEARMRALLADGYQAVLFRWDETTVGYCLYRLYPKYAFIRQFYLQPGVSKRLNVEDAFALLRKKELGDYASIRLDVPETAKESLR